MTARAGFLATLGPRPVEHPAGVGEHIRADPTGRTDVPGVRAAGNVTDPFGPDAEARRCEIVAGERRNGL